MRRGSNDDRPSDATVVGRVPVSGPTPADVLLNRWAAMTTMEVPLCPVEELFCLCLDQETFRLEVAPHLVGLALAAVEIGALTGWGHLDFREGQIWPTHRQVPPKQDLDRQTWAVIASERAPQPVRDWLVYLARDWGLLDRVVAQLTDRGLIMPERRGLRRRTVYETRYKVTIWGPMTRLRSGLLHPDRDLPAGADAFLLACLGALGRKPRLIRAHTATDRESAAARFDRSVTALPPHLRELIAHLQTAVAHVTTT
jgi:hypothetical protein